MSTATTAITTPLEILCVSQFTLHGKLKGNKVDFHRAMKAEPAKELYDLVLSGLRKEMGDERVKDGVFGAMMQVEILNDGRMLSPTPISSACEEKTTDLNEAVTIELDSRDR